MCEATLEESEPLFEYVFPRFAYRWKYIDNEYSVLSPFTEVAFIGTEFEYVSTDGYNSGMSNNIRKLVINGLTWGSQEVVELDILYKESDQTALRVVESIPASDITSVSTNTYYDYVYSGKQPFKTLPDNEITRVYDKVPLKALSKEIINNRFKAYFFTTAALASDIHL